MSKLKPCPFCGEKAFLKKISNGYKTNPTTIMDTWTVTCPNNCCNFGGFEDKIYHDDDGRIVVERDGADEAGDAWNKRA